MWSLKQPAMLVGFDDGDGDGDAPKTLVVSHEGADITVTLPEGWEHQDDIKQKYLPKDQFARELERRVAAKTRGLVKPDDLLNDEDYLGKMLGIDTNKELAYGLLGLKPGEPGADVDVPEIRRKIEEDLTSRFMDAEIKPRDEKIEGLQTLVTLLRERDFSAAFSTAAINADVHDEMYEPLTVLFRRQFKFDEKENGWYRVGEDGELEVNINPEPNGPRFMTIGDVLKEERRSGKHKTWFKAPGSGGGGYQGGGRGGGSRKVTYEEFKAMSDTQKRQLRSDDVETWNEMLKFQTEEGQKALHSSQH